MEGWQYADTFNDPDDLWTAEPPPQVERLLSGNGAVTSGLPTPSLSTSRGASSSSSRTHQGWVRRRRWVRLMRRRLDIPPLPFLQPDGSLCLLASDGTFIPYAEEQLHSPGGDDGQELGSMPTTFWTSTSDYVARARYLVGNSRSRDSSGSEAPLSGVETRRTIAKLERATTELRQGLLSETIFLYPVSAADPNSRRRRLGA